MIVLFLGIPGSGKGTQAKRLAEALSAPYVGTGDILRYNVEKKTPLGLRVSEILEKGKLVDDETMIELIKSEIKDKTSFVLDGFPRTVAQADALENLLRSLGKSVTGVIFLDVGEDEVVRRITGRVFCPVCRRPFNIYTDKLEGDRCPECGEKLIRRNDDTPETIRKRIRQYREKTAPLVEYYKNRGVLKRIDGSGSIYEIFSRIGEALNNNFKGQTAN